MLFSPPGIFCCQSRASPPPECLPDQRLPPGCPGCLLPSDLRLHRFLLPGRQSPVSPPLRSIRFLPGRPLPRHGRYHPPKQPDSCRPPVPEKDLPGLHSPPHTVPAYRRHAAAWWPPLQNERNFLLWIPLKTILQSPSPRAQPPVPGQIHNFLPARKSLPF